MSLLPPTAPRDETLKEGSVVVYEQQGAPLLGLVLECRKHKYLVLNERGSELELAAVRLHQLPGRIPSDISGRQQQTGYLAELRTFATEQAAAFNLEELWSFVVDEVREYSNAELCALYFGDNTQREHLTLRFALLDDSIFFKRKKEAFQPRPAEVVAELKKAEEVRGKKQLIQELTLQSFAARMRDANAELPSEVLPNVRLLEDFAAAAQDLDAGHIKEARQLISLCYEHFSLEPQGTREEQAYRLLLSIRQFTPETNLSLIRHRARVEFPDEVEREAEELRLPASLEEYPDASVRCDFSAWDTVTIDDATTKDMDDALSIEQTADGYRVGVHISDVACLVAPESAIDLEARVRSTSLYFPDRTINMLPDTLSAAKCSLREGELRPCLSCVYELDRDFQVRSSKITPSVIRVRQRLDYAQVDELLEQGDDRLNLLYHLAMNREELRFAQGGFKVNKKEMQVVRQPDGDLALREIDENAPSRAMVGEMMILANETIAAFCRDHHIPILYRSQDAPDEEDAGTEEPSEGLAKDYLARAGLKPTSVSFNPGPHHTLGIAAYTHATSPIRRYVDLCNQRQILWFLREGKPLYTEEEYQTVAAQVELGRSAAAAISKESRRFWFMRYLRQRAKKNPFITATVLRCDRKLPLIELHEVYMPTIVKLPFEVKPGDELQLRINRVNPPFDELRLEAVRP